MTVRAERAYSYSLKSPRAPLFRRSVLCVFLLRSSSSAPDSIKHHFESECAANFVKLISLPRECVVVLVVMFCVPLLH